MLKNCAVTSKREGEDILLCLLCCSGLKSIWGL